MGHSHESGNLKLSRISKLLHDQDPCYAPQTGSSIRLDPPTIII